MMTPEAREVSESYDAWAATYDSDANPTRDLDAQVVRTAQLPLSGSDVVEVGCGTGKNTAFLASRARSVVGLDFSHEMLARARMRVARKGVRFVEHDVRDRWPLQDESADVVVANLVLEHVAQLGGVYAEAARVLRPRGRLLICELHPERQRRGGQPHFRNSTGEICLIPTHRHTVAEYVNEGITAGLRLEHLGEWLEDEAPAGAPPRLFSVQFSRPG